MYTLYCNNNDITNMVGSISWSDSTDTLGVELTFSLPKTEDNKYLPSISIECGDIITLKNEKTIFQGIVITKEVNGLYEESISCYDFLFYLNQSKVIKQFNFENASSVIKNLCTEFSIPIGTIPSLATSITGVYYEETVAEIIEGVLESVKNETGKTYYIELEDGALNVYEKGSLKVTATYKPTDNVAEFDITKAIGKEFSKSYSIEDLKNSILIISTNDDNAYLVASKQDTASISKYGLLQEIETVDEEDLNSASNIADNLLKELNVVEETISITLIGNDNVRAGRVLTFNCTKSGIIGDYLITSCTHNLTKQKIHKMELELELI